MSINIITDRGKIRRARGYWSKKNILINANEDIVVLDTKITPIEFKATFEKLFEYIAKHHLQSHLRKKCKQRQKTSFTLSDKIDILDNLPIDTRISVMENKIDELIDQWWCRYRTNPIQGIKTDYLSRMSTLLSPLLIDREAIAKVPTIKDLISKLAKIAQLLLCPKRFGHQKADVTNEKHRAQIIATNLPAHERDLICWLMPFLANEKDSRNFFWGCKLAAEAAMCILTWARLQQTILLPPNLTRTKKWVQGLHFPFWENVSLTCDTSKAVIKAGVHKLIISTTINKLEDIPSNVVQKIPLHKYAPQLSNALHSWLRDPAIVGEKKAFPVDYLRRSRIEAIRNAAKWTPDWLKKEEVSTEWCIFAKLYWNSHEASTKHKTTILQLFLKWALNAGYNSPWQINSHDIWNISDPHNTDTFYAYVEKQPNKSQSSTWSNSHQLYNIVTNVASKPGSPFTINKIVNPFNGLDNPFSRKQRRKNKTHRSVIPHFILEEMIDILLSPDADGNLTFDWAKNVYSKKSQDWVKVQDPENNNKTIEVWCPSRAACLAILLITPIRGAQARWLDQGLMDNQIFDPNTAQMSVNTHTLRDFRYENGKTHEQQYGRPSGILQFDTPWAAIEQQASICMYVNTNKTQLWDPSKISGYEIPWPDGAKLLESNMEELRAKGEYLARLYKVITYQLNWMTKYNPNPNPLSFYDVPEDRDRVSDIPTLRNSLPWFVPLFRDVSDQNLISVSVNNQIYYAHPPVSKNVIRDLYNRLAVETESRLNDKGYAVTLTKQNNPSSPPQCVFDIHSLRVTMISRLAEMGVPIHIIEQYLAGHSVIATTLHYLVMSPEYVRNQILNAVKEGLPYEDLANAIDKITKEPSASNQIFYAADRFSLHTPPLPKNYAAFVPVEGGVCPMGGKGSRCNEGGVYEKTKNTGDVKTEYGQVLSGCGNCRFFLTGPDFLLDQVFALNALMLRLREKAKERKQLSQQIYSLELALHNESSDASKTRLMTNKVGQLKAQLHALETPMGHEVMEWHNRYTLVQHTDSIITSKGKIGSALTLIGSKKSIDDYKVEIRETSDFGLVRMTLEGAILLQHKGIPIPADVSLKMQRFLDIIITDIAPDKLLLKIRDAQYAARAAALLSSILSEQMPGGDDAIQEIIDGRVKLKLPDHLEAQFPQLLTQIHQGALSGFFEMEEEECKKQQKNVSND